MSHWITAALHQSSECNKMAALGYINTRKTNFLFTPMLYSLDCHRRWDIHSSRLYVNLCTRLRSISRCPASCARSVHKFSGKNTNDDNLTIIHQFSVCLFPIQICGAARISLKRSMPVEGVGDMFLGDWRSSPALMPKIVKDFFFCGPICHYIRSQTEPFMHSNLP